jgi:hypothetical protein
LGTGGHGGVDHGEGSRGGDLDGTSDDRGTDRDQARRDTERAVSDLRGARGDGDGLGAVEGDGRGHSNAADVLGSDGSNNGSRSRDNRGRRRDLSSRRRNSGDLSCGTSRAVGNFRTAGGDGLDLSGVESLSNSRGGSGKAGEESRGDNSETHFD